MVQADTIIFAVDWAFENLFPSIAAINFIAQIINQIVLWRGKRAKRLNDPVYAFWIAYGFADIVSVVCVSIDLLSDGPITLKWLAWFDWSVAWYPGLYLQFCLAAYYIVVLYFPLWYFQNSDGPNLRRVVRNVVIGVFILGLIIGFPMALPGYDVCYCPDGSTLTQPLEDIYTWFQIWERLPITSSLICYCFLAVKLYRTTGSKNAVHAVGEEQNNNQAMKEKRNRRLLKVAFISWSFTAIHPFFYDLQLFGFEGNEMAGAILYAAQVGSYILHMSCNPWVQAIRNTAYREELKMLFGLETAAGKRTVITASQKLVSETGQAGAAS